MKIGDVEGTPEEIRNFLYQDEDFDLSAYVSPEKQLPRRWLIIPSIGFILCLGVLTLSSGLPSGVRNFISLLGGACVLWIGVSAHIRFKISWSFIGIIIIFALLILMVGLGDITPSELLNYYKEIKE